jgi:hypothetical protein
MSVLRPERWGDRYDSEAEKRAHERLLARATALHKANPYRTLSIALHPEVHVCGRDLRPDFLVTRDGRSCVFEVDGPHHNRRFAHDRSKDYLFENAGFYVQRISVEDTTDPEVIDAWIDRILERLSRAA